MKKSTLRSAAAAAALATGLAAASVTTATAAPAPAAASAETTSAAPAAGPPAAGRIATPQQLADSLLRAVALEAGTGGGATDGNVVGYLAPQGDTGTKPC
ncbi:MULTISPECIES: hypothetical protein [Streptomyces]|uniref:Uncharacterized protein n=2 Tax=Streptomyces TaxID=1883 RepID=A0A100Y9F6_9ACTN|nr:MULTISPECIES: hypothetical protein [Streptomyces]KUH40078.1 hypothetical protein ATE80_03330 [Streptomyces kanasensis]UUS32772.1 hypothetical protein NRO40_19430 [Streptomyces changanensis]